MKRLLLAVSAAIAWMAGSVHAQFVANLDDLNYWGSGPNRAAFVVYWNDSKSPAGLAWGYKWSGNQTVFDMFMYLASNDPLLFGRIDSATAWGPAIFGIGYQTGATPFGVTGAQDTAGNPVPPIFSSGIDDLNTNPSATEAPASSASTAPSNSADRYKEGWSDNGYWELFHSGTDKFNLQSSYAFPTAWTSSWVGSGVALVDGAWAAFSITEPDFISNPPTSSVVAAIPEPSTGVLLALAGGVCALCVRRGCRRG